MGLTATRDFFQLPNRAYAGALLHEIAKSPANPEPRRVDKPLGLYGAGDMGQMARAYLERIGVPIAFVVDLEAERLSKLMAWQGIMLLRPQDVSAEMKRGSLLAVCIATVPYAPLEANLVRHGWSDIVPFYDIAEAYSDRHPLSNGWIAPLLSAEDVEGVKAVLYGWDDDISRAHHLQFLSWRRLRAEWRFVGAPVVLKDRYFIPEVHRLLTGAEAFADIGAHTGCVIRRFLSTVGMRCGHIWAVEPDLDNLLALRETVARLLEYASIEIIPAVVARSVSDTRFAMGLGYASQISALGNISLSTTTIDLLKISPSFLKLHLEGCELSALEGAVSTLDRCRPILAVTSYHNVLGLWRLPDWLRRTLPSYRFLMRLHSWVGTGAVIYGIPNERLPIGE